MWNADLIRVVQECRAMNEGMRFGQLIFNAVALHDKVNYTSEYDANFHSRLFNIYDEELVAALKEWIEFCDEQRQKRP
jgi:hypothetical protein